MSQIMRFMRCFPYRRFLITCEISAKLTFLKDPVVMFISRWIPFSFKYIKYMCLYLREIAVCFTVYVDGSCLYTF